MAKTLNTKLLEAPYIVNRDDLSNGRWYYSKDKKGKYEFYFPSVTTILSALDKGEGFARWLGNSVSYEAAMEYGGEAAKIGTITHAYVMYLLYGEKVDTAEGFQDKDNPDSDLTIIDNRVNKRLEGFEEFIKEVQPIPLAVELMLYNPVQDDSQVIYPWAGQIDSIYKINNKIWLVDLKTGKEYKTHSLQLTAYKLLWDSLFPEYPIDYMACLYIGDGWRKKPTYKLKKYKFEPDMWLSVYDMWQWLHADARGNYPTPKFRKKHKTTFEIKPEYYQNKKGEKENDTV